VKQELFKAVAFLNKPEMILATNTSSLPIEQIAAGIPRPQRVVGMHFFNPPHIMKLVEVVSGKQTSSACSQLIFQLALKMDRIPVMVKDSPGFLVNRIGKLFHTESIHLLEQHHADAETMDSLLEATGFRMGPFRLIDLIGVDANLNVTKSLYEQLRQERFAPSLLQQKMVDENKLGRKSGEGFYRYEN
jgi:3-hydroxybutyryl-CoA dehydrogenase